MGSSTPTVSVQLAKATCENVQPDWPESPCPPWREENTPAGLLAATLELLDRAFDLLESAAGLSRQIARCDEFGKRGTRCDVELPPRAAQQATFRKIDGQWVLSYEGPSIRLRHTRGLDFIAQLLRRPGARVHALDLVLTQSKIGSAEANRGDAHDSRDGLQRAGGGGLQQAAQTVNDRRQCIAELRSILDDAVACNDWARATQARERIERISDDLLQLVGFGAGYKRVGSAGERARINVTRAIASSIQRINSNHQPLGSYLERTIRTGTFCTYAPDPRAELEWVL